MNTLSFIGWLRSGKSIFMNSLLSMNPLFTGINDGRKYRVVTQQGLYKNGEDKVFLHRGSSEPDHFDDDLLITRGHNADHKMPFVLMVRDPRDSICALAASECVFDHAAIRDRIDYMVFYEDEYHMPEICKYDGWMKLVTEARQNENCVSVVRYEDAYNNVAGVVPETFAKAGYDASWIKSSPPFHVWRHCNPKYYSFGEPKSWALMMSDKANKWIKTCIGHVMEEYGYV